MQTKKKKQSDLDLPCLLSRQAFFQTLFVNRKWNFRTTISKNLSFGTEPSPKMFYNLDVLLYIVLYVQIQNFCWGGGGGWHPGQIVMTAFWASFCFSRAGEGWDLLPCLSVHYDDSLYRWQTVWILISWLISIYTVFKRGYRIVRSLRYNAHKALIR